MTRCTFTAAMVTSCFELLCVVLREIRYPMGGTTERKRLPLRERRNDSHSLEWVKRAVFSISRCQFRRGTYYSDQFARVTRAFLWRNGDLAWSEKFADLRNSFSGNTKPTSRQIASVTWYSRMNWNIFRLSKRSVFLCESDMISRLAFICDAYKNGFERTLYKRTL